MVVFTDGVDPGVHIHLARGAKCTKIDEFQVNCIPTIENTKLPFVCKKGKVKLRNPIH